MLVASLPKTKDNFRLFHMSAALITTKELKFPCCTFFLCTNMFADLMQQRGFIIKYINYNYSNGFDKCH